LDPGSLEIAIEQLAVPLLSVGGVVQESLIPASLIAMVAPTTGCPSDPVSVARTVVGSR
jgi:hypothetical protein